MSKVYRKKFLLLACYELRVIHTKKVAVNALTSQREILVSSKSERSNFI